MDDVSRCRQQLASFRIRELKDVLSRLRLPKQGKKQVLMDKIMGVLVPPERPAVTLKSIGRGANKNVISREECVNVIDDIYRKLRGSGAPDLASAGKKGVGASSSSVARSEEPDEATAWGEAKTRCPCGNSRDMGVMIQCDDSKCGVWQHISCVVIPEKPGETVDPPEVPSQFYCELCRINRSDPFRVTVQSPLVSTKLSASVTKTEGANIMQNVEKTFHLSSSDRDLLHSPNHDLQVWCVLLNDKVPFRMHWPAHAELRINGVTVRVTNRPGTQLLGVNGRDEGPGITTCTREGVNRISFLAYDARPFCLGVRIIRRNSAKQVLRMIPDVTEGEEFEEALARVRRCINGSSGQGTADDGDDSDLEVVAESVTVTLRCPVSGGRIKVAGRFKPCLHMGCFDLDTFVEFSERTRKWQCPICLKNYSLENLVIDPFFNRVTTALKSHVEDVTEVEMKADGLWRPKVEGEKSREPWRTPDGSIVVANGVSKQARSTLAPLVPVKVEEGVSSQEKGSPRKVGMKRPHDGQWAVNGIKRVNGWGSTNVAGPSERPKPTVISRSSSATDSNEEENGEDGERSVNQEASDKDTGGGHYADEAEVSFPLRVANTGSVWPGNKVGAMEKQSAANLIILSDTDDEDGDNMVVGSSGASGYIGSETLGRPASARPVSPDLDAEIPEGQVFVSMPQTFNHVNTLGPSRGLTNSLENHGSAGGALGLPLETMWTTSLRPPISFNYFPSGSELPAAASAQPNPPIRPTAVQAVTASAFGLSSSQQPRETTSRGERWKCGLSPTRSYSSSDCNGGSADGGGVSQRDSSLRLFLPHQPARAQVQPSLREPHMSSVEEVDNTWFSLSLGGPESNVGSASTRQEASQGRGCLDSLASTASEVLLGMNARTAPSESKSKIQSSPPYGSPVHSLSPVPPSPTYGRVNRMSPMQVSPPRSISRRSPVQLPRHRPHYFRVDSDSD